MHDTGRTPVLVVVRSRPCPCPAGVRCSIVRDDELMARALRIAAGARRHTPPWPWVGCVVARNGEVVGEGATGPFRAGHHAEGAAVLAAGERARGATAYVTLEPCDHDGSTPACTSLLLESGIARVVVAVEEPDPTVAGRGLERLCGAGVDVLVGVGADAVEAELAPYLYHRRTARPFTIVKLATTIDARVAAADGTSQWITSGAARADAHELRADSQAIVVGAGTAIADRPTLTVRDVDPMPRSAPTRVVFDARGRVDASGPLFDPALAATLVITSPLAPSSALDAWTAAGAKVEVVDRATDGRGVDLDQAFARLGDGREGFVQVLVEGGGELVASVLAGGHARRLVTYVAPLLLGEDAIPAYRFAGPSTLSDARRFRLAEVRRLGQDVRLDYDLAPDPVGERG
jgi:diaminohydroxyphosphoribosylaminopyrimidine deaminase / 5-amino-6-(5-phosphoribosylamino)uracil reductase